VAHTVSLFKHHQISSNTALNAVFGECGYLADEAEMGLILIYTQSEYHHPAETFHQKLSSA